MVAKILRSTSFLITRLALTPSFSESSLTVMPSEMVISRLIGGGPAIDSRRRCGRRIFSSARAVALLRRGWDAGPDARGAADRRSAAAGPGSMRRRESDACGRGRRPSGTARTSGRAGRTPVWLPAAGRDEWDLDRSAGREPATTPADRGTPGRGGAGCAGIAGRGGLLQAWQHIGARRNHGPRGRLTGKRPRLVARRESAGGGVAGRRHAACAGASGRRGDSGGLGAAARQCRARRRAAPAADDRLAWRRKHLSGRARPGAGPGSGLAAGSPVAATRLHWRRSGWAGRGAAARGGSGRGDVVRTRPAAGSAVRKRRTHAARLARRAAVAGSPARRPVRRRFHGQTRARALQPAARRCRRRVVYRRGFGSGSRGSARQLHCVRRRHRPRIGSRMP